MFGIVPVHQILLGHDLVWSSRLVRPATSRTLPVCRFRSREPAL